MTIDMNKPLELGSDEANDFLKSLQGNILESHQLPQSKPPSKIIDSGFAERFTVTPLIFAATRI